MTAAPEIVEAAPGRRSGDQVAIVHEYCESYFIDKDTIQAPLQLARLLDARCAYFTRWNGGVDAPEVGIRLVGGPPARENLERLERNTGPEVTFSKLWQLRAVWQAARTCRILALHQLNVRTVLGGIAFKCARRLWKSRGVVYVKLDLSAEGVARMFPLHGRGPARKRLRAWLIANGAARAFDVVSAESDGVARLLRARAPRLSDRILIVRNCPSPAFFRGGAGGPAGGPRRPEVLVVGRLGSRQKATDIALECFARFHARFPGWTLRLVGPATPDFDGVLERYRGLVDSGAIRCEGPVYDKAALGKLYAEAAMFLFPSRYEGASVALVEACYFGCVPVCTDVGNAADVLGDWRSELTTAVDDIEALAARLASLAADEARLRAASAYLGERASEYQWPAQMAPVAERIRVAL